MIFTNGNFNFDEVQFVNYSFWWILIFMSSLQALCLGLHVRFYMIFFPKGFSFALHFPSRPIPRWFIYDTCLWLRSTVFAVKSGCYSIICWKAILSPGNWICQKSVKHIFVSLFLGSPSCVMNLDEGPSTNATLSGLPQSQQTLKWCGVSHFTLLCQEHFYFSRV